ncbi:MAG: adenylate/guanylate cyclase domain-containing protein [Myxococcota bacterium]
MARVTIIGVDGRRDHDLLPHTTVGRHPNNTLQVLDRIVSKEHCHIDLVEDRYVLRDLGSLNGTYVNGARVEHSRVLQKGDEIQLGSTRIIYLGFENSAPEETALAPPASQVTMTKGIIESHIRTKLAPLIDHSFLPEKLVQDELALRRDYEKLRASYEVIRAIGVELDVDKLLERILDTSFALFNADRGVVLLYVGPEDAKELTPRCVRSKGGTSQQVNLSTTILNEVLRDKAAVLSSDASVDSRFQGAHSVIMQGIRSSMAVPLIHTGEVFGVVIIDSQIAANAFTEKDLQLLQNVANQAAIAIQNSLYAKKLEAEAVTRERFQRLLSPAIAQQVLEGKVEVRKGGELRETTILFIDIRGFTAMSESRAPQELVDMLNEYFELMVEIIFKYEGTLDKFVGDEIMALYGSPVAHSDDPLRAVLTALEMLRVLEQWNRVRAGRGVDEIQVGIGINTGDVIAGYLGSSKALEYTVIGDATNVAARLCSVAKAGQIIISEETYRRVNEYVDATQLPPTQVKGKSHPIQTYSVQSQKRSSSSLSDPSPPSRGRL